MSRFVFSFLTGVSALALVACTQQPGSPDGQLTDQEKRSFQVAQTLVANGNLADARSMYEELAKHPEAAVQADLGLADIDKRQGQNEDAVTVLQAAQKQDPGNPVVLTQLGYALLAANHPEDAVNVFDELIAMQPDNPNAYNAKAVAFDKAGNHVAAQEIYEKALALAPNSQAVRNNLAMSYILNGQTNDAITILEPMVKQKIANATMRQNLALAYGIKGDRTRAMQLNMQDVTPEQAKDNMRFYEKYAHAQREHASVDLAGHMHQTIIPADTIYPAPTNSPSVQSKPVKSTAHAHPVTPPVAEESVHVDEENDIPVDKPVEEVPPIAEDKPNPPDSFLGMDTVYDYPKSK